MKLQVLGPGCSKCQMLEQQAKEAAEVLGPQVTVEKITDMDTIMEMGVMITPALAVDGEVKSAGKILNKQQIIDLVQGGNYGLRLPK